MLETIDSISKDTLKNLCKSWKCKKVEDLIKKTNNPVLVTTEFFNLRDDAKNIFYYILKNNNENIYAADIAYKLGYDQKQFSTFFDFLFEIENKGFIYLKKKRMRLNSNDDSVHVLPTIRDILLSRFSNHEDIESQNTSYNLDIYKKYKKEVMILYKETGYIDIVDYKSILDTSDITLLSKANIITLVFSHDKQEKLIKTLIKLGNIKLIKSIKKEIISRIEKSELIYNHLNIISSIDNFIYSVESEKMKPYLGDENIIESVSPNGITNNLLYKICYNIGIIKIDSKNNISIDYDSLTRFSNESIYNRRNYLLKNYFQEYEECIQDLVLIIDNNKNIATCKDIYETIRLKSNTDYSLHELEYSIYIIFILGFAKVAFYENEIIALKNIKVKEKSRCIINGNFEVTLINHEVFSEEFIYMCSLYFNLDKNGTVYLFKITEESILKGKTLVEDSSIYSFYNFLEELKIVLKKDSLDIPKHLEVSMTRWYEKSTKAYLYENIMLINIKNSYKLEEIIHDAKRKGIEIKPISEDYAIIKSNVSRYILIKFLRTKKIITIPQSN